MHTLY